MIQLSCTSRRWILEYDEYVPDPVSFLVKKRNISDGPFRPPSFSDTQKAIDRITCAIDAGERIAIFGDYDCDGITATAQFVRFFRKKGADPIVRLPHRQRDGYGLKEHIIREFVQKKIQLLIMVDTGIASASYIETLRQKKIDTIVFDHHAISDVLPPAFAIIHSYDLCAAGIVHAFLPEKDETDLVLACIGTIADIVALRKWNRTIVQEGILALQNITNGPIAKLKENAGISSFTTLIASDVAFRIAPRINAAGRMDDPMIALNALLDGGEALEKLEILNRRRQSDTRALFKDALKRVEDQTPFICIASPLYPPGIIGLIAGKLSEIYGKPTLVGSVQKSHCIASLRSPGIINVTEALQSCAKLFLSFGGHARAAGCTFSMQNFSKIHEELSGYVQNNIPRCDLCPSVTIDLPIEPHQITPQLFARLTSLEPFGEGNREPRFLIKNIGIDYPRLVGLEKSHLQANILGLKSIGFNLGKHIDILKNPVDIVFSFRLNQWNGRSEPQIVIEDLRPFSHTGASLPSI